MKKISIDSILFLESQQFRFTYMLYKMCFIINITIIIVYFLFLFHDKLVNKQSCNATNKLKKKKC